MQNQKQKQLDAYQSAIKKEQDEVVMAYMPALRAMAYRLKERLPANIDVNDLMGCGVEEMIKLSRKYDKNQNDSFWGYASKRVYGAMLDYLRTLDVMSRANRTLLKNINSLVDEYFNEHEEEPSDEYLAAKLGEDINKIRDAREAGEVANLLSLDDQLQVYSDENTEQIVERDDLIDRVSKILKKFNEREQLLIQLYYYEELNLKEISDIMHISESRISQINKRLMSKIRQSLGA
ncbi:MAG: RNA polymerase sigma factor FliA [Campylobacter sp.]|nr:RNA polymerase sigma factor FliA [Campylobacter sp.]